MKQGITRTLYGFLCFLILAIMLTIPSPTRVLAAGNANLVLVPASMTVNVGSSFDVAIQVQTNGDQIRGVQAYLDFDPSRLQIQSITSATTWSGQNALMLERTFDNDAGQVNFGAGVATDVTGTFTITTINFIARSATTSTTIVFHFAPPAARDTGISDSLGFNLLGTATGATITIIGTGGAGGGGSATAPQLVSISLSPTDPSISQGASLQFAAIGGYSDKSTGDITGKVTWSSSDTAIVTVQTTGGAAPGLATALAAGIATITATMGVTTAISKLTVTGVAGTPVPPVLPPIGTTPAVPVKPTLPSASTPNPVTPSTPSTSSPSTPLTPTTVTPPASSPQPPPAPDSSSNAPNFLLLGGIAVGVIIIVVASFVLLKK